MAFLAPRLLAHRVGAVAILFLCCSACQGIILHPAGEPPANWADKPPSAAVGSWAANASCIAVSPNYIITTRHQAGVVGATVIFNGTTYLVAEIWTASPPTFSKEIDLRVCRITTLTGQPANLTTYTPPYPVANELGQKIVRGGYGRPRGTIYSTYYSWATSDNKTLRWGTNTIETAGFANATYSYYYLLVYFYPYGSAYSTPYECAAAEYDSGGGWFIRSGDQWYVAGIGTAVTHLNASYFIPADYNLAARISQYADWIRSKVPEADSSWLIGDINHSNTVDWGDFAVLFNAWLRSDCGPENNYCGGADLWPDGKVDLSDLQILIDHWLSQ